MKAETDFVYDMWYFAGLASDVKKGTQIRLTLMGQPICLGRRPDGTLFALRDICPHRAAPLSAGCQNGTMIACPYHGWTFDQHSGTCTHIPALCADQDMATENIKIPTYRLHEDGHLIWIYMSKTPKSPSDPDVSPPQFTLTHRRPTLDDSLTLNCHVDHAVIGLMDPAHGPYVHKQWWWRSARSIHEKAKAFEPRPHGFAMRAHTPSSNSFAYKILGGQPITEITFQLPGIRTEEIKIGRKTVLSFTAVTPLDAQSTLIRQVFFTDHRLFRLLSPILGIAARKFLRQDGDMVDLQHMGLKYDPTLMLIDDADTQAKWYYQLKRAWATSRKKGTAFKNPVTAKTLKWRS